MEHEKFLEEAKREALKSNCGRAKCGSVIVKNNKIIGKGFNSPPKSLESQRRCEKDKSKYNEKVTDKTCCIHAEQRAIFDALKNFPDLIEDSILYFTRVNSGGDVIPAGEPYCTICSKSALDIGVKKWVLLHSNGIKIYDSEKYNEISFSYNKT